MPSSCPSGTVATVVPIVIDPALAARRAAAAASLPSPTAPAPLLAPPVLTLETRTDFRARALEHVEASRRAGVDTVDLDLSETATIDASGLGILVLVCKRARDRSMGTRLLGAPESVRRLLSLTKLDYLFEFTG